MFIWVQVLRGMAATMVVCHHYVAAQAKRGMTSGQEFLFGGAGVDIFFVISGFIMTISQSDAIGPRPARVFLLRRLLRIAPLYWMLTATAYSLATVAAGMVNAEFSARKFIMSMLFLPYSAGTIDMGAHGYRAYVLPMAWTLTFEWWFYLLFALALALGMRPLARLGFIACCFIAGMIAGIGFSLSAPLLQVLSSPLLLEFLLGCVVAVLYLHDIRLKNWQAMLLALAAATVLVDAVQDSAATRLLTWGVAAFVLVAAAVLTNEAKVTPSIALRPLIRLGDISYSLYLSHFFTLALFVRMQKHLTPLGDGFGVPSILVFLLLAWNVAALCHRFIEEPARTILARRKSAPRLAG